MPPHRHALIHLPLMTPINRQSGYGRYLRLCFNLSDLALFNLVFWLALIITHATLAEDLKLLWVLVNVSYLGVLVRNRDVQHKERTILLDRVVADGLISVGLHALFFLSLSEILSKTQIPLKLYLVYYALMIVALPTWNVISRRLVKFFRRKGYNYTRTVIVGTNPTSERLREELESDPGFGYRLLGFFDDVCREDFKSKTEYRGSLETLDDFVVEHKVDQIYYTLSDGSRKMQSVIKIADRNAVEFFLVPPADPTLGRGFQLHNIGAMPVLAGRRNPLKNPLNSTVKRLFDFVASSIFLVTVYPLVYIPVAIGIKLTSPGPVYFKQKRTGYEGRSFNCLKFRTMHVNKEADSCQATPNDKRKTRFGDFLRRTSLDELPQFINVWKGDMSIVGPRPHMLKHTEDYSKLIDQYMVRHIVKPGITGWAQVNGYRGVTDKLWKMERRVEFDVWYIENWTFLLDLKIIVRTIINAFNGESNAY